MTDNKPFDIKAVTQAVKEGIARAAAAQTMDELKAVKSQYAGAQSVMTVASKAIGSLPADQKKEVGKVMSTLRADFGRAFAQASERVKAAEEARMLSAETVDMTLPVNRKPLGARHPIARIIEDFEDFFVSMGWQISAGPEVETEWFELWSRSSCSSNARYFLRARK